MRKINNEEFNVLTKKEGIILIDFYANWCGPCKMLTPILEQFIEKTEGEVEVYKVDVDDNPELCTEFNISSIPSLLFFKNGKLVFKEVGFRSLDYLIEILNKIKEAN
jgi:thioredoxin 1